MSSLFKNNNDTLVVMNNKQSEYQSEGSSGCASVFCAKFDFMCYRNNHTWRFSSQFITIVRDPLEGEWDVDEDEWSVDERKHKRGMDVLISVRVKKSSFSAPQSVQKKLNSALSRLASVLPTFLNVVSCCFSGPRRFTGLVTYFVPLPWIKFN